MAQLVMYILPELMMGVMAGIWVFGFVKLVQAIFK